MTQTTQLYNSVAPLRNVAALVGLIERVNARAIGLPGMAVFYGYTGFGKTTAAVYAANKYNAVQVQVKEAWTGKKLGQAILGEMGLVPAKTIADMIEQIAQELMLSERVLIVDDAQYLIKRGMIGHVRDIYESSGGTVILIGEERMPQELQRWPNIHGRILDWVGAEPACLADLTHLARIYCPNVTLDEEFAKHLLKASHHSIRRVCANLNKVKELALVEGFETITEDVWGGRDFYPTLAPAPRRELA